MGLSTILQKGHTLEGADAEAVTQGMEHFTTQMNKFLNKDGGKYAWSAELDEMTAQWSKLVLGSEDKVPGSEISYKDLNEALPKYMEGLPAEIVPKKEEAKVAEPVPVKQAAVPDDEPEDDVEAPDDAAAMNADFMDAFGSDSDDDAPA